MLPKELQNRKHELQTAFNNLSGSPEIVIGNTRQTKNGDTVIEFSHSVRVRPTGLRLHIREEFRDIDTDPKLHSFSYQVTGESDLHREKPIFRYECHPDAGDPENENDGDLTLFRSPYQATPHFHPDGTDREKIRKLHFPFHREERKRVVFAIVAWLRVDLVKRFYKLSPLT
jgi:hypothetical protein